MNRFFSSVAIYFTLFGQIMAADPVENDNAHCRMLIRQMPNVISSRLPFLSEDFTYYQVLRAHRSKRAGMKKYFMKSGAAILEAQYRAIRSPQETEEKIHLLSEKELSKRDKKNMGLIDQIELSEEMASELDRISRASYFPRWSIHRYLKRQSGQDFDLLTGSHEEQFFERHKILPNVLGLSIGVFASAIISTGIYFALPKIVEINPQNVSNHSVIMPVDPEPPNHQARNVRTNRPSGLNSQQDMAEPLIDEGLLYAHPDKNK
ncbi:MAG: hypothetical protein JWQ35_249 [Bacteriovoracaceae bacterium]|nr:hypothetical protein [Bacteriovoracaceae bacterium]